MIVNNNEKAVAHKARPFSETIEEKILLDLAFFVFDMLTHNRIIFPGGHLFCHGAGILLGHIEMTGPGTGIEPDFDGRRLRHGLSSCFGASRVTQTP